MNAKWLENDSAKFNATDGDNGVGRFQILPDDGATFSTHKISTIRHNFHQHPLMQLSELAELAKELEPLFGCRFLAPTATHESKFDHKPRSHKGLKIAEVFQRIEEPGSWIALYNIENIPRYRLFLQEALNSMRQLVEREQPGIFLATGFIFISAPPSVTPFHIDRENNFWLQVRGRKSIGLWDREDRDVVAAADVEDFIVSRNLAQVRLNEAGRARVREFDVGPGDGMYFPSTTPHMTRTKTDWVSRGDGVSISIGVNFYTSVTRRHARVHHFNRFLRHFGVNPRPPGGSGWLDELKEPLGKALAAARKIRDRSYLVPPGTL